MNDVDSTLYQSLISFLQSRNLTISDSPLDNLVIPLKDGRSFQVPLTFLRIAGEPIEKP